jgi:hypothetical protein
MNERMKELAGINEALNVPPVSRVIEVFVRYLIGNRDRAIDELKEMKRMYFFTDLKQIIDQPEEYNKLFASLQHELFIGMTKGYKNKTNFKFNPSFDGDEAANLGENTAIVMPVVEIPMTPEKWELYKDHEESKEAAKALGTRVKKFMDGLENIKIKQLESYCWTYMEDMHKIQMKYTNSGAADSEPYFVARNVTYKILKGLIGNEKAQEMAEAMF